MSRGRQEHTKELVAKIGRAAKTVRAEAAVIWMRSDELPYHSNDDGATMHGWFQRNSSGKDAESML